MKPHDENIDIGFQMHIRRWEPAGGNGDETPFLLVHGLSSNAETWDGVAQKVAAAGHPVVAIDQRGHGLSEKPPVSAGYDFATVTSDLVQLIGALGWERPIVAGQSWGGNVMLALGAKYPGAAAGLIFVDGGFFDVKKRAPIWEEAYEMFKPPHLAGTARGEMRRRIRAGQPEWSPAGIEATLANFETLADGTIRPWLTLDRHMAIFRALWEQDPGSLYPSVQEPVLICPAGNRNIGEKRTMVAAAADGIARATVHWFPDTAHDIHVHRPDELANLFLRWANSQGIARRDNG